MSLRATPKNQTPLPKSPIDILGVPDKAPDVSLTGPGGQLKDQFRMTAEPDLGGAYGERLRGTGDISRLRDYATSEGLSSQEQMSRQAMEQRAKEQGAAAGAGAMGRLAMRGGVGAGARERLAGQAMGQTQRGLQDIGLQTGIESERSKMDMARALPGMNLAQESSILGADQADVGRREGAQRVNILSQHQNVQNLKDRFQQQMEALGAEKAARAEAAGKK